MNQFIFDFIIIAQSFYNPLLCFWVEPKQLPITLNKSKFIFSEKATNFCEISTIDLSYAVTVKSAVDISQNCGLLRIYELKWVGGPKLCRRKYGRSLCVLVWGTPRDPYACVNPSPSGLGHVTLIYGLILPMAVGIGLNPFNSKLMALTPRRGL